MNLPYFDAAAVEAAGKLARDDASSLLMVGTGRLSRCLIEDLAAAILCQSG